MDEKRAEYLVERYADTILRIGYTWHSNLHDAQDICQIVFIKLLEHPKTFSDAGQEKAWVIRVAINECKNRKKSAWFRKTVPLDQCLHLQAEGPEEQEDSVLPLVQKLPLKYRQVISLRYYEEYEVQEIAELLNIKPNLVSTRLRRARAKLKEWLKEDEYGTKLSQGT